MEILFKLNFNYLFASSLPAWCWDPCKLRPSSIHLHRSLIPGREALSYCCLNEWMNESSTRHKVKNLGWMTIQGKSTPFFSWQDFKYLTLVTMHNFYPLSFFSSYCMCVDVCVCVTQSYPTLCHPVNCSPPGSSVHGILPGKNTRVGCNFLLQIFLTQGSNPCLLHCRQTLYCLSHLMLSTPMMYLT